MKSSKYAKFVSIALILTLVLSFVGCTKPGQQSDQQQDAQGEATGTSEPPIKNLRMGIGSMGGTYDFFAQILGPQTTKLMPGLSVGTVPGGDYGGLNGILKGDRDTAFCFSPSAQLSYEGKHPFTEVNSDVRFVGSQYDTYLQLVVRKGSGIKSLADLKGKKVGIGTPDQIQAYLLPTLLESVGLSYEEIEKTGGSIARVGYGDGLSMLQDRQLDMYMAWNSYPWSSVMEVDTAVGADLMSLNQEEIDHFFSVFPKGFTEWVIPKGTYSGMAEDVNTLALTYVLVADKDLHEDVVYTLCEAMYDDPSIWAELVKPFPTKITLDRALLGASIPIHPGAERYYKEKGLL